MRRCKTVQAKKKPKKKSAAKVTPAKAKKEKLSQSIFHVWGKRMSAKTIVRKCGWS